MNTVSVEVGGELDAFIQRLLKQAAPTVAPRMEQEVRELMAESRVDWPIGEERGRPHSRDTFSVDLVLTPDGVEARLSSDAPYLYMIRPKLRDGGGTTIWRRLLVKPAELRANALALDLSEELARMAGG
jgi:hypothetical protein